MSESFQELFEESLKNTQLRPGTVVKGIILDITGDEVIVDVGLKSEAVVDIGEFKDSEGTLEIKVGDEIEIALETVEDGFGETRLSREKAKRYETWKDLVDAHDKGHNVSGIITGKVKGGYTVEIKNIRAFLPGSLIDVRPVKDSSYLEGKELEFRVIKIDQKRNNIVVSRRQLSHPEGSADREAVLRTLEEGKDAKGVVKNLTDYGAFVDLGGIDGLLHITDMAWKRIKHPSEILAVGDEINVKILKFDRDRSRVSLGLKQMGDDPWKDVVNKYPMGARLQGKVTNLADYGCFVEIGDGVEGLVHVSEMDWTNKNIHPSKVVQVGDEVNVMVLEIDEDRRRISLGLKQCISNPWEAFAKVHQKGEQVQGKIRSITDFGIFIGLEGNIDGLVHLSDISWTEPGEQAVKKYKKGDEITTLILAIDADRERISLGVKQMSNDPFGDYINEHAKGSIVTGVVTVMEPKHVLVELAPNVVAYMKTSELSRQRIQDPHEVLSEGQTVEAKIINVDRKNRNIHLSIKAKETQEQNEVLQEMSRESEAAGSMKFGDLLKEQMDNHENEQ